jgi:chromosome partitioning protein
LPHDNAQAEHFHAKHAKPANVAGVIALATASQKGGVGKTTVCINLGHALARRGWNVLLADTDAQGGIGLSLSRTTRHKRGFYDFLAHGGEVRPLVLPTRLPEFSILPCGTQNDYLRVGHPDAAAGKIRDLLRQCDMLGYDLVILDTAAGLNGITEAAVRSADWALIPQQAEPLAARSVPLLLETLARFRMEGSGVRVAGILLTMLQSKQEASLKVARELRELLPPSLLFGQAVPRDEIFLEASAVGLPLALMRRNPPPAALVFDQIAAELETRISLTSRKESLHPHASLLD